MSENAELTRGRPFAPGNAGRPKGSKSQVSLLMEEITSDPQVIKDVASKIVERAKAGAPWACTWIGDRLWPLPRGRLVEFPLPELNSVDDVHKATNAILQAVASGVLTIEEGEHLSSIIAEYGRPIVEQAEEDRIANAPDARVIPHGRS
jgi:hypothetical protein